MKKNFTIIFGITLILAIIGYGGYSYWQLNKELQKAENDFKGEVFGFENKIKSLESELLSLKKENMVLDEALLREQNKNSDFERQIKSVQESVDIVQKLHNTDKELLQKYSKVYFLNENYIPKSLSLIDSKYLYNEQQDSKIHSQVLPFLQNLLDDAKSENVSLQIVSAYRSFYEQTSLKANYRVIYGKGANQFSADQGYSEHQLGTAVDFNTPDYTPFLKFETSEAYEWLLDNAYKYGFVLSYPKENAYYQFEPWHWRYVGVELATRLYDEGIYFYDLDQREIDAYLIYVF